MAALELKVTARGITGKKVKSLRDKGIVPVHLFGHNIISLSLQSDVNSLDRLLRQAGTSRLVDLTIDGDMKRRKVLVKEVQRDFRTGKPLHVDFYEVSMKEKIKVEVPLYFMGESPAIKAKKGILLENIRKLDIECLPDKIPERIEVDINSLSQLGDCIHVGDLKLGEGIVILTGSGEIIIKVTEERVAEEVKPAVPAAAEVPVAEAREEGEEKTASKEKE